MFRSLSIHNEQNGNPQILRSAGSVANAEMAQTAGSRWPLAVQTLRWRMQSPSPLDP